MATAWGGGGGGAGASHFDEMRRRQEEQMRFMQMAYANSATAQLCTSSGNSLGLKSEPQESEPSPILLLL